MVDLDVRYTLSAILAILQCLIGLSWSFWNFRWHTPVGYTTMLNWLELIVLEFPLAHPSHQSLSWGHPWSSNQPSTVSSRGNQWPQNFLEMAKQCQTFEANISVKRNKTTCVLVPFFVRHANISLCWYIQKWLTDLAARDNFPPLGKSWHETGPDLCFTGGVGI